MRVWTCFMGGVKFAICEQDRSNTCLVGFLDELGRTAMLTCEFYRTSAFVHDVGSKPNRHQELQSFLDFAMWYHIDSYVYAKGPLVTQGELQHAINYRGNLNKCVVPRTRFYSNKGFFASPVNDAARERTKLAVKYVLCCHRKQRRKEIWHRITKGCFD